MATTTKTSKRDVTNRLGPGQCPACGARGALVHFAEETLPVQVGDLSGCVEGLAGERCKTCREVFLAEESAEKFSNAGDALVLAHRRIEGASLKAARKQLGLTQAELGHLIGGGHNGVSRYESGKADPGPAVFNLLRLLRGIRCWPENCPAL